MAAVHATCLWKYFDSTVERLPEQTAIVNEDETAMDFTTLRAQVRLALRCCFFFSGF